MKLFGLAVLSVLLAAAFAGAVAAEKINDGIEATVSATDTVSADAIVSPVAAVAATDDADATGSLAEVAKKCIVTTAAGRTVTAACAVKYCNKPAASASDFEKCVKLRIRATSARPVPTAAGSGQSGERVKCSGPVTSASEAIKCARLVSPSANGAKLVTAVAGVIRSAEQERERCKQQPTEADRQACILKVTAFLERARGQAADASSAKEGMRYALVAKAIGVELTDDAAPAKIEAEVKARDDAYKQADDDYKASFGLLKDLRLKKISKEHKDYKEAVSKTVLRHVQRLKAALSKLEAAGVDVTGTQAKLESWSAAWNAATTKEAKLEVIKAINTEWPALRQSLQEKYELARADGLSARVLNIAATARVTAAGVDARKGDSTAIIAAAAKLEGIAAKLSAAATVGEAKAAKEQLEPALKELREAIRAAVATVTGAVVTPAPEASATAEATDEATGTPEATAEPTAAATPVATTVA